MCIPLDGDIQVIYLSHDLFRCGILRLYPFQDKALLCCATVGESVGVNACQWASRCSLRIDLPPCPIHDLLKLGKIHREQVIDVSACIMHAANQCMLP